MRASFLLTLSASLAAVLPPAGCQRQRFDLDEATIQRYRNRVVLAPRRNGLDPGPRVRPVPATQPATTQPGALGPAADIPPPRTSRVVRLSLRQALHRALANSLDIKVESFSPGISAADIIAAEAAFDAALFADFTYSKLDEPTNSTFFGGGKTDNRHLSAGLRKRLATGGEISASYTLDRNWSNQPFQRFNPRYDNDLSLELSQPLLKGLGVDVNRAEICIARNTRDSSLFAFRRKVIDTLSEVEQAYWSLYFAHRSLAIQRALLAETRKTRETILAWVLSGARKPDNPGGSRPPPNVPELANANTAVASRQADVIRLTADVKDAQDRLKNLLNDPALPLEEEVAVIPTDAPLTQRVAVDPNREWWTALENRPDLQEARLSIANANITRGVARNQLLPKLDLYFQWNVNGLRGNFPDANEQLFAGDFQDYVVGLSFEFPIGNRSAEAGVRKSQLQLEQAVAGYHDLAAQVMTDVRIAVRDVQTSYDEILANQEAAQAADQNLSALVARRVSKSPESVDLELRAQEMLGNVRRALEAAIANYNSAIIRLEQAKGTLLHYDRVEVAPEHGPGRR